MSQLDGKAVVVTGAGRGLGRAYAERIAYDGGCVVVNDIDNELAQEVCDRIEQAGGRAVASDHDVTDWQQSGDLVGLCRSSFGKIDGLVNNAGLFGLSRPEDEDPERVRAMVEVNVLGSLYCGLHALKEMAAQGSGALVNVTSGAFAGISDMAVYGATKGAVASMTYGWAVDMAEHAVRVNAVSPLAPSRMFEEMRRFKGAAAGDPPTMTAEDNALVVSYLLSDAARKITGQIIRINPPHLSFISHPAEVAPRAQANAWSAPEIDRMFQDDLSRRLEPLGLSAWGGSVVD